MQSLAEITFFGDVSLLDSSMSSEYDINGEYVFNLEYVISNSTETPKLGKVNLAAPPVDFRTVFGKHPMAVGLANNHTMDFGAAGFRETLGYLEGNGIKFFGAGSAMTNYANPCVAEGDYGSIALLGYSFFDERQDGHGVASFDDAQVSRDIGEARKAGVDAVIVNMHWGAEESPVPNAKQREVGRSLIDQGVDLVIGHHPHCIQPFEIYKGKHVFYSLGNTIFPDFSVSSFYNETGIPQRIYRKRQLRHNRLSFAVRYDVQTKKVTGIDKLLFHRSVLKKVGQVDPLGQTLWMPLVLGKFFKQQRKYFGFVLSNCLVDGMIFDVSALKHEVAMKARRLGPVSRSQGSDTLDCE